MEAIALRAFHRGRLSFALGLCLAVVTAGPAAGRSPEQGDLPAYALNTVAPEPVEEDSGLAALWASLMGGGEADADVSPEGEGLSQPDAPGNEGTVPPDEAAPGSRHPRPLQLYRNDKVDSVIAYLMREKRDVIEAGWVRSGRYLPMIRRVFGELGLPADLAYLAAVESSFHPKARSPVNAVGLWQLMAPTARKFGLRIRYPWYDERLDPERATWAAGRFLAYLYDRYGQWELVLAAYNAGEGRVNSAMRRVERRGGEDTDYWSLPLPRQTRGFVPAFLAMAAIYGAPQAYGLDAVPRDDAWSGDTVELGLATTLEDVARRLDAPLDTVRRLNPAWRRGIMPNLERTPVLLRVPHGDAARLQASLAANPPDSIPWLVHTVREGQTVSHVAEIYGVSTREILALNGLGRRSLIHIGQQLLVPLAEDDPAAVRSQRELAQRWQSPRAGSAALTRPHTHAVAPGESLWSIARRYNVRMGDLRRWNDLEDNVLQPRQELLVYVPTSELWPERNPGL